ncbi:MAG: hypothetical protein EA408_00700 [Marinilabiliales bacterium]|nr:MAG: hypothetical protein EA408_00700 [Marinilabiliales bacterium]
MHTRLVITALLVTLISGTGLKAQFSLSGEYRPRTEFRHGFQSLMFADDDPAFFISQRTRLNLGVAQEDYSFGFSFQDVRVWGEVPQLNRSDALSSVHEAWGEVKLSEAVKLKAGRQEIVYDNARIFGNVDWAQQGRSHDAAVLKWQSSENTRLHAGFAFNQDRERRTGTFYPLTNYKTFQYLWLNRNAEQVTWSLLMLNTGYQNTPGQMTFLLTTGGRLVYSPSPGSLSGSAYLQAGDDPTGSSLLAWYLAMEYAHPLNEAITLSGGFELLSGTDEPDMATRTRNNSFTPLFGTNHAFNGHMDYFYVGNHLNDVGLIDFYGGMNFRRERWSAGFRLHAFISEGEILIAGGGREGERQYLGTEIDIFAGYTLFEQATVRAGYSQMFATEAMERLKGGSKDEVNNWVWLMLVLRPSFLKAPSDFVR